MYCRKIYRHNDFFITGELKKRKILDPEILYRNLYCQ